MKAIGKNQVLRGAIAAAAILMMTLAAPAAHAAGTPGQKCEAGKNDASGKYAACVEKATKALVTSGDSVAYDAAVTKCRNKFVAIWSKLEAAAVSAGTTCPSTGDQPAIEDFADACVASVAGALAGGPLPMDVVACNDALDACLADQATCDGDISTCESDLAAVGADLGSCEGVLAACEAASGVNVPKSGQITCYNDAGSVISCAGTGQDGELQGGATPSYTDNGNGTITDNVTGLMWEKLSDDGSIHDKDNTYSGMSGAIAKATTMNGMAFAGHSDWRVPNRRELLSIADFGRDNPAVNPVFHTGCSGGCTVLTCSCTRSWVYWTTSTYRYYTLASWKIIFDSGDIYAGNRSGESHHVRLVRNAD